MSAGATSRGRRAGGALRASKHLFDGAEWDFAALDRVYKAIEKIAVEDLGLNLYPNQIEIISSEQMLDAYSSVGMPLMYQHWSFGKRFIAEDRLYRKGARGLAYEIVINSNPCITYCMAENTMAMQALVIAHAAFGHNHFFKNNNLFQQWTDAAAILGYFEFAKRYIAECEERHGLEAVEDVLDAAHAIMNQGVFRYRRSRKPKLGEAERRLKERRELEEQAYTDLWRTLPNAKKPESADEDESEIRERKLKLNLPEENLLYFIEKNSPVLESWQREVLRIVRNIAQYFYPQKQTKLMNEGCATFVHYYIANKLFDRGLISEGALLEILHSHSNVIFQPAFDDPRFSGINPYALGFAMMRDIKRICEEPTDEDCEWFPDFAGAKDWRTILKNIWADYRDESFVGQFLSPRLIRDFRFFMVSDRAGDSHVNVEAIHDEAGYRKVRTALARSCDVAANEPDIQVSDVNLRGDRELILTHNVCDGVELAERSRVQVLKCVRRLWGYEVRLKGVNYASGDELYEVAAGADEK
jgi:spore cortex formation protein SpoVR/YcgB (stage V sporulation)